MIIQNVIFPDIYDSECALFYKYSKKLKNYNESINSVDSYSFKTYFNSLSIRKWIKYTTINNFKLEIIVEGHFVLNLFSIDNTGSRDLIYTEEYDTNKNNIVVNIPIINNSNIIYFDIEAIKNFKFHKGYYSGYSDSTRTHFIILARTRGVG